MHKLWFGDYTLHFPNAHETRLSGVQEYTETFFHVTNNSYWREYYLKTNQFLSFFESFTSAVEYVRSKYSGSGTH